ncbi:hypothetical protein Pmar_PMAR029474 [Perkinsus marinus ATCC 50983]|uniref:SWIM-type domain-containing protein n=1 Tax=Perkinsus marinus (strain ATCC 50983 / TXsc) TaxID=423536 RepID=C5KGS4_PERM5|nr:hypothetical protein Pmar_PMAR029474 [Perkinsus marinus ATCC 50983]EER16342.1 hypothetical protein Pmar_PMAR029474 [Perkinsus marinus ATCC 50983]|eukprot:XP_002784546.1 hypothetical protein Pmar_PMAR029474 [Perkinsus marinus ATCC 50983]
MVCYNVMNLAITWALHDNDTRCKQIRMETGQRMELIMLYRVCSSIDSFNFPMDKSCHGEPIWSSHWTSHRSNSGGHDNRADGAREDHSCSWTYQPDFAHYRGQWWDREQHGDNSSWVWSRGDAPSWNYDDWYSVENGADEWAWHGDGWSWSNGLSGNAEDYSWYDDWSGWSWKEWDESNTMGARDYDISARDSGAQASAPANIQVNVGGRLPPSNWRGNWSYIGSLKLQEEELNGTESLNRVNDLADRIAGSMGDCSNLRVENTRKTGADVTMKSLECRDHDNCGVRLRAVIDSIDSEVLIFRNDKSHSEVARGSALSRFSTIKLAADVRAKIKLAVRANRNTTAGDLYAKFVAPHPINYPSGEDESAREYRRRLKKHVGHIKKGEIRQMRQEGFESVEEFSRTTAQRHSWAETDWAKCLQLLQDGSSLKPGMVHIGSMIGSEHYCIAVCPTAGIESLYHYAKAAAKEKSAITIYCDGQPSVVRGNDSTTYTIGVSKVSLTTGARGDQPFRTSLCPVLFCLLDSENKVALGSAFGCFKNLLQRIVADLDIKIGGAVVDADVAAVQALRDTFGNIMVHRCRWHREQSIAKADKLTAVDRAQAKSIGEMLERSGDPMVHKGILKCALADTKTFSTRLRKYLQTSSEERFGTCYLSPVWYDDVRQPHLLTMSLDNNISESFNAVVKRKLGRRMASGYEVYTHFLEISTILDAYLERGTFTKYDTVRLTLLDSSISRASTRLPTSSIRVSEEMYLVASAGRAQQKLMSTDIEKFHSLDHLLLRDWDTSVLSLYSVRWLCEQWVCQCMAYCQSGQCHHVAMIVETIRGASNSQCSAVFGRHAVTHNTSSLLHGSSPSQQMDASSRSSTNAVQPPIGKRRIADGVLRKNGRPQYWGPALKKNKTDTMPIKPIDLDSLPPHIAATVRDNIYESHD